MELEKVLFVIVLYKQSLKSSNAFQSLLPVVAENGNKVSLFVYDNSPNQSEDTPPYVSYVHEPSNPGVSRAYNAAFSFAKERGFTFLLLMDQDSFFPEKIFRSYSHAVAANPDIHVFAPVAKNERKVYSPFRMVRGRGIPISSLKAGIHSLNHTTVINSGLLVSLEAFEKAGGYDERFPLDFSDIDFCERLADKGFKLYLINESIVHDHSSESIETRTRFEIYLKAVALFKKVSKQKISYWLAGFPRALKLSTQTRDSWFLQRFFNLRA